MFCGCTTWSVALTEKHTKNKVTKGTSRPNRMEVLTGGQRKWQYGELHDLFLLLNFIGVIKSRRRRWVQHVACMGEKRNAYEIMSGEL